MSFGTASIASYVSHVASSLQHLSAVRQQQIEVNTQAGESIRRARDNSATQSMQDNARQAELVNDIRSTALKAHGGGIDVWA